MGFLSTTIKVPVADIQDLASKFSDFSDDNADLFDQVLNALNSLQGSGAWVGDDIEELISVTSKNREKFQKAFDGLSDMASEMKRFAEAMQAEDEALAAKINAV